MRTEIDMPKHVALAMNWSKRVPLEKIKRLYHSDAQGMLDDALLDEVGHGLYMRCCDIREFKRACAGEVTCRNCGHQLCRRGIAVRPQGDLSEVLKCRCGWQMTWGDYLKKSQGNQLGASDVELLVEHFIGQWPQSKTPSDKLLLIDWLIHQFHVKIVGMGNLFGVNMLSGSAQEVFDFLNTLAYGDNAPHQKQMRGTQALWQQARELCRNNKPDLIATAKALGISGARTMTYDALFEAIIQASPNHSERIDDLLEALTKGLRKKTIAKWAW